MVERVVGTGESLNTAIRYIQDLAENVSPTSLRIMKAQVYRHLNMELGEAMIESNHWMDESLKGEDFKEGVNSFIERRKPNFTRLNN